MLTSHAARELRNTIYELVLGHKTIHIDAEDNGVSYCYKQYICSAESETDIAIKVCDSQAIVVMKCFEDRHTNCFNRHAALVTSGAAAAPALSSQARLYLGLLGACKQTYKEGKFHVFFLAGNIPASIVSADE